jgi:hypothetical protein
MAARKLAGKLVIMRAGGEEKEAESYINAFSSSAEVDKTLKKIAGERQKNIHQRKRYSVLNVDNL